MKQKNRVHSRIAKMLALGENPIEVMPISSGLGFWLTIVPRVCGPIGTSENLMMQADFRSCFKSTLDELENSVKIGLHGALGYCVDAMPYTHQVDITIGYPYFTLPQHSIKTSIQKIISVWEKARTGQQPTPFYYTVNYGSIISNAVENDGRYFYALFGECRDMAQFVSSQLGNNLFDESLNDSVLVVTKPVLQFLNIENFKKLNLTESNFSLQKSLDDSFWMNVTQFIGRNNDL